jgi:hypothetical protein
LGKLIVISVKIPEDVYQELQLRVPEGDRSNFIRDAILEKLGKIPKPDKIFEFEERVKKVETDLSTIKKLLTDLEILTYERGKVNPHAFCIDDLDRKIVDHLLQSHGATTPELARAIGADRWTILNRLQRIQKRSKKDLGKSIVEFYAGEKAGRKRAWWLTLE